MPLFYFHLIDDIDVPDAEGRTLADLATAREFAIQQSRALIAATTVDEGRIVLHHRIDIEDEEHELVGTVHFRDAVTVEA